MKSIVLLSGGLDSTVSLAQALKETEVKLAITYDYGQRAAVKEGTAATSLAAYYKLNHKIIKLPFLNEITGTALVNRSREIPEPSFNELDDVLKAGKTAAPVWVPNRNGVFINIAAAYAEAFGCGLIVTGFNKEEAAIFPDNSAEFTAVISASLGYSTLTGVKVVSYTQRLDKLEIVKLGERLKVPFQYVWSCYSGGEKMCGKCESCLRLFRALKAAGINQDIYNFV